MTNGIPPPLFKIASVRLAAAALAFLGHGALAQDTNFDTGMPFGLIGQSEIDRLEAFAKQEGTDLMGDMQRAYDKDNEALSRVFRFSLKFTTLDDKARTYGQIVYSSFLSLSETRGVADYAKLVAAQPEAVRQRIRDFIYYDSTQAPPKERREVEAETRKSAPLLFPRDYVFGSKNPLFKKS